MNPWQMAQQIKHEIQRVTWPDGDRPTRGPVREGEVVFGEGPSVAIFAGAPSEQQIPAGFPWCLVGLGSGDVDEDHPQYIRQQFTLTVAAEVLGDPMGEQAVLGGPTATTQQSAGRGVGELTERVRSVVQNLTGIDGASMQLTSMATGAPTPLGRNRHVVLEEMTLEGLCTSELYYAAPQHIKVAGSTWTWEGAHCSDRFDFKQYRIFHRADTYPESPDDDESTLAYTGPEATWTGTGNGTFYAVFADYSSRKQTDIIEGSSDPVVGSIYT